MRWLWLPMLGGTVLLVVDALADGGVAAAAVYGLVGLALTWWLGPWQGGGGARHAQVMERPPGEWGVVVYWRPGCVFCARLRARLGRAGHRATWVDIWRDAEAAAFVRSVNEGNETVPTVVVDGRALTNPDPAHVRALLTAR
ncbi:glutaredoxin family protein [Georgenia sp. H159]|uniref:glutaredoxin family protein n=1 Tax=Georgenia sp. H159 TaxID=3076115 RepID=UPI002D76D713|nr:glutaredoxin domain-containing protein [Georgenia sp. H159]